jgi:branched-chain amino acid transport system permease protein
MRFQKKTRYVVDIRLFEFQSDAFWYIALVAVLLATPLFADDYTLRQLSFVFIYGLAGVGLMLLSGFTGLLSLGHAAFLGVGAYTAAILQPLGVDFSIVLVVSIALSAAFGIAVGLPALRLYGLYLAIATLAFAFIAEQIMGRWDSLTRGHKGLFVKAPVLFGVLLDSGWKLYLLAFALVLLGTLVARNLLRTPTGRAMIAIRDSETAARSMGVNVAWVKTLSFAISAAYAGVAGALLAHSFRFVSPAQFTPGVSIELLILVFIGGVGSLRGAHLGAIFVVVLPQLVAILKDWLPEGISGLSGLQSALFGLALMLFILFEPGGMNALWLRLRFYLEAFPLYRRDTFRRQRAFAKGEKW